MFLGVYTRQNEVEFRCLPRGTLEHSSYSSIWHLVFGQIFQIISLLLNKKEKYYVY